MRGGGYLTVSHISIHTRWFWLSWFCPVVSIKPWYGHFPSTSPRIHAQNNKLGTNSQWFVDHSFAQRGHLCQRLSKGEYFPSPGGGTGHPSSPIERLIVHALHPPSLLLLLLGHLLSPSSGAASTINQVQRVPSLAMAMCLYLHPHLLLHQCPSNSKRK